MCRILKSLFIALNLLYPLATTAQVLSQNAMMEDYNQFTTIVNNYYALRPQLKLKTGTDASKELNSIGKGIANAKTAKDFAFIMKQAFAVLNDGHLNFADKSTITLYTKRFGNLASFGNVSLADTLNADRYFKLVYDSIYSQIKCGLRVKYIDGKYYNVRPFNYNGAKIKEGLEVRTINDISIDTFISKYRYHFYDLRWDESHRKWYSEMFFLAMPELGIRKFTLTIGESIVAINLAQPLEILLKEHESICSKPFAEVIDKDILYLRIPFMFNEEYYLKLIHSKLNDSITKVVLDVRSNRGGQDVVWQKILGSVLTEPVVVRSGIGALNNTPTKRVLNLYNIKDSADANVSIGFYKFIEISATTDTIKPLQSSSKTFRKIYVIQDEDTYSAASSLTSLTPNSKSMELIGNPPSRIAGRGLTPLIFKLKNSGIVFRMPFTIDLSNMENGNSSPAANSKMQFNEDINNYLDRVLYGNPCSAEYLNSNDKLINYIKLDKPF